MTHLTRTQRDQIDVLNIAKWKQKDIAHSIGCDQSTISRELSRNNPYPNMHYQADVAQKYARKRRSNAKDKLIKWYDNPEVLRYVISELRDGKSPEQISGRMKRESLWHHKHSVSHESIYQYIWKIKDKGGVLHKYLRRKGRRPKFYGLQGASASRIPNRRDISKRPKIVDKKKRCGDWESDLIVGPIGTSPVVATFVERFSKYAQAILLTSKSADEMVRASQEVFSNIPKELCLTMTHDNGLEICGHEQITSKLGIVVYCARAYHSWERGLNEHTNGLLREFFPKGTDFSTITSEKLAYAIDKINNRPRRSLQYRTPKEVFLSEVNRYAFQS